MHLLKKLAWLCIVLGITLAISGCGDDGSESSSANADDENGTAFAAELELNEEYLNGLSGKLLFVEQRAHPNFRIAELDLETGQMRTLFAVPENGWVYEVTAASDGRVVFSYSPPTNTGEPLLDRSGLYMLPNDALDSSPQLLVEPQLANAFNAFPVFSRDNARVLYSQLRTDPDNINQQIVTLMEYKFARGETAQLIPQANMATFGPSEDVVAYINVNRITEVRSIYTANLTNDEQRLLIPEFEFYDLGRPLFSADGQWIYFVVLENPLNDMSEMSALRNLLLGSPAYAHENHNLPADWWRKSLNSGIAEQVTELSIIIHDGSFSADGYHLAFSTEEGVFVMGVDGGEPQLLIRSRAIRDIYWAE